MTMVLVPVASKYEALQDKDTLRDLVIRGTRYSFIMVAVIMTLGIPLMRPFYVVWMGPDYAFLAPYAVAILIAGAIGVPANCAQQVLDGSGRVRLSFYATFAAALLSLPLLVFFIYAGRPLLGMTLCTAAALIVSGLAYNLLVVWLLQMSLWRFLWRSYVFPGLGLVPAIGVVALLSNALDPQSPLALAGIGSAGALIYIGYVAATLSQSEWKLVRDIWADFRGRVRRVRRRG